MDVVARRARLDVDLVRGWAATAAAACAAARDRIDAVNVFPVPDGDTGSNVALTVAGGRDAVRDVTGVPVQSAATAFAHGAARSARGNSGVILSQWLVGFAAGIGDDGPDEGGRADEPDEPDERGAGPAARDTAARDAVRLVRALTAAADAATTAVPDPQEGTVLTVARDVARTARAAVGADDDAPTDGADPAELLAGAVDAARGDLRRVSAAHDVLRAARVVDAGACALLVVLDALVAALRGATGAEVDLSWLPAASPEVVAGCSPGAGGAFEVMMLVRGVPADRLVGALRGVGDAVAVADAGGALHAHVHADDPAAVLALVPAADRERVVVRRVEEGPPATRGLVVLTRSPGLAAWYATCGAVTLVGDAPDADQLARATADARTGRAVVVDAGTGADVRDHDVVAAAGDGAAVVACLALLADPDGDPAAGRAALDRLRTGTAHDASGLAAVVDGLVAAVPAAQAVTLAHGLDAVEARAAADVVARAHPELEVLLVGPVAGEAWWAGVD
ncbi:DAK2 domain-containing protein [Cellulomonas sp. FA1]|uniref:DAK2 domain-containing protein n=1 Tax=Cellulomonas sp. FA1 TaxID=1346710 RepID=UPI000625376C|nr:DAK2 domain-containing protein [Cellulomonas sp. FA1]